MQPSQHPDALALARSVAPDGYEVDRYLAQGGQGAVFRGRYRGQPAAIKLYSCETDPRRLLRELSLLEAISHPSLVRILGSASVTIGGQPTTLVAYEFHEGGDLCRFAASGGDRLTIGDVVRIGLQIGQAIETLWSQRIVHRDIKPANIVMANASQFVLVDVGFARHLDLSDITVPGGSPGTQGYKSPEQAAGRRALTLKSDFYSLGITLYELLTQSHPFNRRQPTFGSPAPQLLETVRSDCPRDLALVIQRMMDPHAPRRPLAVSESFQRIEAETRECS